MSVKGGSDPSCDVRGLCGKNIFIAPHRQLSFSPLLNLECLRHIFLRLSRAKALADGADSAVDMVITGRSIDDVGYSLSVEAKHCLDLCPSYLAAVGFVQDV